MTKAKINLCVRCADVATYRLANDHGESHACRKHVGDVVRALCSDSDTCVEKLGRKK